MDGRDYVSSDVPRLGVKRQKSFCGSVRTVESMKTRRHHRQEQ